jgi:hypothetical protein
MQQHRVTLCMTDAYSYRQIKSQPKGRRKYMFHMLGNSAVNVVFFTSVESSPERKQALKDFWQHIKTTDKKLYKKLYYRSTASTVNFLPSWLRTFCMKLGYRILNRKNKFE